MTTKVKRDLINFHFYSTFEQFYWHLFKSNISVRHNGPVLGVDLPAGKIGGPVSEGAVSSDGVVTVRQDREVLADAVRVVAVAATGEEHVAGVMLSTFILFYF